jgi:hypothetical protein
MLVSNSVARQRLGWFVGAGLAGTNAGRRRTLRTHNDSPSGTVSIVRLVAADLSHLGLRSESSGRGVLWRQRRSQSRRVSAGRWFYLSWHCTSSSLPEISSPARSVRPTRDVQSRKVIASNCPSISEPNVATAALRLPLQVCETARFSPEEILLPRVSPRAISASLFFLRGREIPQIHRQKIPPNRRPVASFR